MTVPGMADTARAKDAIVVTSTWRQAGPSRVVPRVGFIAAATVFAQEMNESAALKCHQLTWLRRSFFPLIASRYLFKDFVFQEYF